VRWLFLLLALGWIGPAHAGTYVLQCTTPCRASDGTTRPIGTFLQKVEWDGVRPYAPPGFNVVPYTNQTVYQPAAPAQQSQQLVLYNRLMRSGTSDPSIGNSGIFFNQDAFGFTSNGGIPWLNYFRITTSTTGTGDQGWRFWSDVKSGSGGRVPIFSAISNDIFQGYTIPQWAAGTSYLAGQVVTVGYWVLIATSSGIAGSTPPPCGPASTCSDGVVTWRVSTTVAHSQVITGLGAKAHSVVSWGGTPDAPIGELYGLNTLGECAAPNTVFCVGYENDFGILAGGSAETRVGVQHIIIGPGAGTIEDVGWRIASTGGAPLQNLMTWGAQTSPAVLLPTGYGLQAYSAVGANGIPAFMTGAGAIDMLEFAPTASGPFGAGFILRGPGAQILGTGDIQSNHAVLRQTATGASLDAPEYRVTAVSVRDGGSGWTCTERFARGSDGSVVAITAVSGGAVTGVRLVYAAYADAPVSPVTFTPEQPRTCGTMSATGSPVPPSAFTVDATWARANGGAPVLTLGGVARVDVAAPLSAGGVAGVSCPAGTVSLATLVVTNGIVTHC